MNKDSRKIDISIFEHKAEIFERFKKMCGFFESENVEKERITEAISCFEKSFECFEVRGLYSFFYGNALEKFDILPDKHIWDYFVESGVLGVIFYAVSCFEKQEFCEEGILAKFYYDLTGTAVIDVVRDVFRESLKKDFLKNEGDFFISNSFGTGFFGIDQCEIFKFFDILDCSEIKMEINEQGVIFPNKSFVGFFIASENEILIDNDCKNCRGTKKGCIFCKNNK